MKGLRVPTEPPPWRELLANAERDAWYPLCLDRSVPAQAAVMDELMAGGEVIHVHDTIDAQLSDLIKCRNPKRMMFPEDELAQAVEAELAGAPLNDHGRWVFYPWSRRLVHLLPPDDFLELRSDRNRNKITRAEQEKLAKLRVGLVGLSVGNAVAVTLALEGLFGELRLADFDTLDLSNMNRIRCGVHDIGVNKAVICARQIFEQNPYARITIYTDGLTRDNVESFIDDGGRLHILIDECDGLWAKLRIREEARARKIPVLMETSDRGLLDVERFDLEPDRPILHGLLGGLTSDEVDKLPPPMRVGLVLRVVGQDTMSPRAAASMLELGRTVRAFSQLGSDVTLGGATTSIAVRRLGLGLPLNSGRVYVDVSKMLSAVESPPVPQEAADPQRERDRLFIREVVGAAILAPSASNSQPWRFVYRQQRLEVYTAPRDWSDAEPARPWAWVAIGAALANVQITAAVRGRATEIKLFPRDADPTLVAELAFSPKPAPSGDDPLHKQITRRATNRRATARTHLSPVHLQVLMEAARANGAKLQVCGDQTGMEEIGALLGEADRLFCLSPDLHPEFFGELRWTADDARRRADGLDLATLELSPMDLAVLQLVRSPDVAQVLRLVNGGEAIAARSVAAVRSSAAVAYLTMPGRGPSAWVRGGQALQQVWLTASALGLAVQPCNNILKLFARVERFNGQGLKPDEISAVMELRDRLGRQFISSLGDADIAVLRFAHADPPSARSVRLPLDSVLSIE